MSDLESSINNEIEEPEELVQHLKSPIYWVFLTISFLTLIFGIFIIISVVIDTIQWNHLNYPDTLLIGFLLIVGGLILLGGTIMMKNWAPPPEIDTLDDAPNLEE